MRGINSYYEEQINRRLNCLMTQDSRVNKIRNEFLKADPEIQKLKSEQIAKIKEEEELLQEMMENFETEETFSKMKALMSYFNCKELIGENFNNEKTIYRFNGFCFFMEERSCGTEPDPYQGVNQLVAYDIIVRGIFNQSLIEKLTSFGIEKPVKVRCWRYDDMQLDLKFPTSSGLYQKTNVNEWQFADKRFKRLCLIISNEEEILQGLSDKDWAEKWGYTLC